ncbi:MAG: DUF1702 family protein [Candidatus Obscuribacterales bacterium]|nr:DUF1702 family protein [Candidatus Obscuribacterales bacterium]
MQDVIDFFNRFAANLKAPNVSLRKDAPTIKRRIVDEVIDLFITGYNAALETDVQSLAAQLKNVGFSAKSVMLEGAYAAIGSLDLNEGHGWTQLNELMAVAADNPVSINEGIGHALCLQRAPVDFDPSLTNSFWGWMAIDGYGCHSGYFRWPSAVGKLEVPAGLDEFGMHAFDQGLGRAIWLIAAADPATIGEILSGFPDYRKANLWSGIGMMVGYWGADDDTEMRRLFSMSGKYRPFLQQGVAFSATGRYRAGECPDFTVAACSTICKTNFNEAVEFATTTVSSLDAPPATAREFAEWKSRITAKFL